MYRSAIFIEIGYNLQKKRIDRHLRPRFYQPPLIPSDHHVIINLAYLHIVFVKLHILLQQILYKKKF